jgi:integrase
MASIHKVKGSKYWHAFFRMPDGRRVHKSTKQVNRTLAMGAAAKVAEASIIGKSGKLTEDKARELIASIYESANLDTLPTSTTAEFLESWLKVKSLEVADSSYVEYQQAAKSFQEFLGTKALKPMDTISAKIIHEYRAHLAKRVSGSTVNKHLKILRGAWIKARRERLISENVFMRVDFVSNSQAKRRAFTMDELSRILGACDAEWRGMVLFGLYTGQRLGDCAGLTWDNIDTVSEELRITTGKTGRSMAIPLAAPLAHYITTMPAGDKAGANLFPGIANTLKTGGSSTLSRQFSEILAGIGLADKKDHKGGGEGRGARRTSSGLTFHCLRHTATSLLKNAGVSDAVAMEIIGHDSEAISRVYTHISQDALRKAMKAMPDVTKELTPADKSR